MKSNRQRRAEIKAKRAQRAIKRQKRSSPKAWWHELGGMRERPARSLRLRFPSAASADARC